MSKKKWTGCNAYGHVAWFACDRCVDIFCGTCRIKACPHRLKKQKKSK